MDILKQKEQQIEAQRETIATLKKSVERLETELRKCLEPGRDFERPASEDLRFTKKSYLLNAISEKIIESVFQPVNYFVPVESKNVGRYDNFGRRYTWENFLRGLFRDQNIINETDFWTTADFRHGVEIVTGIVNEFAKGTKIDEKAKFVDWEAGDVAINLAYDEKAAPAIDTLLDALEVMDRDRWIDDDQFNDLLCSLRVLSFVLKLDGILIDDDEDDEEEEEKEA